MKDNIISRCIAYLTEHNLELFTLEIAAKQAGISKGGLLHHFKNKQMLLEAIATAIFNQFEERMNRLTVATFPTLSRTQRFILASKEDLLAGAHFNIAIMIMEKTTSNISQQYEDLTQELYQDDLDNQTILMIRLTIDGLYYSRYLKLAPVSDEETTNIINKLWDITTGGIL